MKRMRQGLVVSIIAASLGISGPSVALAAEAGTDWWGIADRGAAISADLIFLRPLGAIRALAGALAYIPSVAVLAPYAGYTKDWEDVEAVTELFILEPVDFTFQRPLGEDLAGG